VPISRQIRSRRPVAIPFRIEVSKPRPGLWVVALVGDHDVTTSGDIRARLREPIESDGDVIIDLAGATFMDSTALSEIVLARHRVDQSPDRRLVLVVPAGSAADSLLGIVDREAQLFSRFESRADALASFPHRRIE